MLKYLDYIMTELSQLKKNYIYETLVNEIKLYKKYWCEYSTDNSRNPLYNSTPRFYDTHNFDLPTGGSVSISWDIDRLYNIAQQTIINRVSLCDFEELLFNDLTASATEILRISNEINSIHDHKYKPILVIYFKPIQNALILEGRHRYVEFKKFKSSELIPFYYLNDELCFTNILVNYQSPKGNWLHGSSTPMGASNNIGYVVTMLTRLNQPL